MATAEAGGDARQLLSSIGANGTQILMMTRYLFQRPLTSDPDAQGIIEMVKVIQAGINRAAFTGRLSVDGKLGKDTAAALNVILPPANTFANTPWLQILQAVADAIQNPPRKLPSSSGPPAPGGGSIPLVTPSAGSSLFSSPYVVGAGVFLGLVLLMGKGKKKGRRR